MALTGAQRARRYRLKVRLAPIIIVLQGVLVGLRNNSQTGLARQVQEVLDGIESLFS